MSALPPVNFAESTDKLTYQNTRDSASRKLAPLVIRYKYNPSDDRSTAKRVYSLWCVMQGARFYVGNDFTLGCQV